MALGQGLGLSLIAEGVENALQLEFLKSIHCDCAQGFFFHKPLPADQMGALLTTKSSRSPVSH